MVSMVVSGFTMGLSTNQPCFMPNHMSCRGESSQPLCDTSLVWINTYIIIYYIIDIIYKHIYIYIHICTRVCIHTHMYLCFVWHHPTWSHLHHFLYSPPKRIHGPWSFDLEFCYAGMVLHLFPLLSLRLRRNFRDDSAPRPSKKDSVNWRHKRFSL